VLCTENVDRMEYKRSTHKILREKPKAKEKLSITMYRVRQKVLTIIKLK